MSCDECECVSGNTLKKSCLCLIPTLVLICALVLGLTLGLTLKWRVLWRCERYKGLHPEVSSDNDCQEIWTTFEQAYVGRDPCDVPEENYDILIDTVTQEIPCDKTLFWSKTKKLAHDFTEKNKCKMTLEDTLLGYMLDGLTWCSGKDSSRTFIYGCDPDCKNNPVISFWRRASANFAASTCGHASVLLNASAKPPYDPDSIFRSVEVKNFKHSTVKRLTAYLVTDEKDKYWMTCNDESLMTLRDDLPPIVEFSCKEIRLSDLQMCVSDLDKPCLDCH